MSQPLQFSFNGQPCTTTCAPGTSLLTVLRDRNFTSVPCTSVHRVCETGDCGSCTVWVNDQAVHSCIYPAQRIQGAAVTTVEGLAEAEMLAPMQQAFLDKQGFQCGYCTPGMILSAEKMAERLQAELGDLANSGTLSKPEIQAKIRQLMDGNICRCTGYEAVVESIALGIQYRQQPERDHAVGVETEADVRSQVSQIGQSVPKQDGPDIVTGKPIYTADWQPAGLLHLKVLRSPHAHARIRDIDTSQAEDLPGVHVVLTYKDVERQPYSTAGHGEPVPDPHDHYLLDNKVRFVGDRVAAVVADSVAIATQACQLIQVDYEILPHVVDPIVAMGERAAEISPWSASELPSSTAPVAQIHDEPESFQIKDAAHNIAGEVQIDKGDIEAGLAEADHIFERTYHLPAVQHCHLEPHVSISWLEEDGTLVLRSSTQVPFHAQRVIADLLNLPREQVRVFKPNMGGGFGNKQEILTEDLCALATLKTGRPAQWEFNRQEEFSATTSRHAMTIHLRFGVKQDGTLTAMEMRAIANTGAYGNHGEQVVFLTGTMPLGLYRCDNQRFLGRSVYTNVMPAGAFRGYGATQGVFAVECLMDEIAAHLGLDSLAMRQRQLVTPADHLLIGRDHHFHLMSSDGLDKAVQRLRQQFGSTPNPVTADDTAKTRRGMGFAIAMQGSGLAKIHLAKAKLCLKPDGRYELRTGAVDVGTGSDTTLRQVAAEVLNTTVAQIDLIASDTHRTPFDAGSYASATLYISGQAVKKAAEKLLSHLLQSASDQLQVPTAELELTAQSVQSRQAKMDLAMLGQLTAIRDVWAEAEYAANESTLTFAAQGAEVEVDLETGRVTVLRCLQVLDIGKAVNPRICRGQAVGGMAMGLGYALQEELLRDKMGQTLNPLVRTYRLPLAKEMPLIEVEFLEDPDPYGPFGAKGIGEIGTNCTAPAIANAVAQATGHRFYQLPLTPERVWQTLTAT
ncbi:MAG: molybdopterin-dependent oxidoreductase [Thainema sp.]